MVIYLKYYRCRCLRWFKYKFMYHERKGTTGLEPVTAKPFFAQFVFGLLRQIGIYRKCDKKAKTVYWEKKIKKRIKSWF